MNLLKDFHDTYGRDLVHGASLMQLQVCGFTCGYFFIIIFLHQCTLSLCFHDRLFPVKEQNISAGESPRTLLSSLLLLRNKTMLAMLDPLHMPGCMSLIYGICCDIIFNDTEETSCHMYRVLLCITHSK